MIRGNEIMKAINKVKKVFFDELSIALRKFERAVTLKVLKIKTKRFFRYKVKSIGMFFKFGKK